MQAFKNSYKLHLFSFLDINYNMGDTVVGTTVKEKDLGVTISADMNVSEQCGITASRGNQILGLIRKTAHYISV